MAAHGEASIYDTDIVVIFMRTVILAKAEYPVRRSCSILSLPFLEYRLRQGFAGPRMRSAAEALAKAASRAMTTG